MSKPRDAIVVKVNGGPAPVDARSVTYDIGMNTDSGIMTIKGVSPANLRPSVDIVPARVGSPVGVTYIGDTVLFTIIEQPYWGPCPNAAP